MTYQETVAAWNTEADEYNQWDSLGEDEKILFALRFGWLRCQMEVDAVTLRVCGSGRSPAYEIWRERALQAEKKVQQLEQELIERMKDRVYALTGKERILCSE